jgi:hypothetical protein
MRGAGRRFLRAGLVVGLGALMASAVAARPAEVASPCPTRVLGATLRGASEVPPVNTTVVGSVRLTIDARGGTMFGAWGISTPSSDITAVEISRAAAGEEGPLVLRFTSVPASGGSFGMYTTAQPLVLEEILADPAGYYVNVLTVHAPEGEVRGQLGCPTTSGPTMLSARLSGANEVPPTNSTGGGSVQLTLDPEGGTVVGSWQVSGLSGAITAGHIHQGAAGTNGDPVVPFAGLPGAGGTFTTVNTGLSPELLASIVSSPRGYYVNVHTGTNPNGEVRGQLVPAGPGTTWLPLAPRNAALGSSI